MKKVEPIGLSCTDFTKLTGKETSSSISITPTVSNCDGGCTYDIKLNGNSVSSGDYTGSISFNGESEAGTKNYTLSMTRTNDNVTESCNFSVEYKEPFEVTCNIADQTDIEQGSNITVTPHSVQGCNADCYYDIKLDGSSVIGGEKGSYDGSSVSFTGANSAGEKNYTLTIYSPDKTEQVPCLFKVTYKESAGGTATCGMWANNNTRTKLPTNCGGIYFKASNVRNILSSEQSTTLSCKLGVEQLINKTTTCKPQNVADGDCDQIDLATPNKAGLYKCSFDAGSTNLCKFDITVADPITCSVEPQTINGAGYVTFSAKIDKDLQTNFNLGLHSCGFKKNGNWKDNNQNPTGQPLDTEDSWTEYVSASTKFTYECKQGSGNKTCTKSVVLEAPPEITNCSELTATKSNNAVTKIVPIVNHCAENCEYHISGDETIDHNNRDWSGGSISLTTGSDVTKNYTLIVENEYGSSSPCSFSITYSSEGPSAIPITVVYGSNNYASFIPGNTYSVTINGGGGVFRCSYTGSHSFRIGSFNGEEFNAAANSGGQATKNNPGIGSIVIFEVDSNAPSDLKCGTDW